MAKNGERALTHLRRAAYDGFVDAQYVLGCLLRDGDGIVTIDLAEAVDCFAVAALNGDTDAMCAIGYAFHEGRGRRRNYRTAVGYYRRAAHLGHRGAMYKPRPVLRRR